MIRPKFGKLWPHPWPHEAPEGVGLIIAGTVPSVLEQAVIFAMAVHGCRPQAGERILHHLREKGHVFLTVQASLDFERIHLDLFKLGLIMSITQPQKDWVPLYDEIDGPWPPGLIDRVQQYRKEHGYDR